MACIVALTVATVPERQRRNHLLPFPVLAKLDGPNEVHLGRVPGSRCCMSCLLTHVLAGMVGIFGGAAPVRANANDGFGGVPRHMERWIWRSRRLCVQIKVCLLSSANKDNLEYSEGFHITMGLSGCSCYWTIIQFRLTGAPTMDTIATILG